MPDLDRLRSQLDDAQRCGDHDQVVALIERIAARPHAAEEVWLPELLWELGQAHAKAGRYDQAIDAQQRAIDAGETGTPGPRATIAEYHLLAGRRETADALFAELWAASPGDVWLCNLAGMAYQDHGDHEAALTWLDAGLERVLETGRPDELLAQLADLRITSLRALGCEVADDLDASADTQLAVLRAHAERDRAGRDAQLRPTILERRDAGDTELAQPWDDVVDVPVARGGAGERLALAWFPADEFDEAASRWAEVATHGDDHATYVRAIQGHLLGFAAHGTKPRLAPITVDGLVAYARAHDRDPAASSTRAAYAAEVARRGDAVPWAPGRNEPCWCGSGTKYKRLRHRATAGDVVNELDRRRLNRALARLRDEDPEARWRAVAAHPVREGARPGGRRARAVAALTRRVPGSRPAARRGAPEAGRGGLAPGRRGRAGAVRIGPVRDVTPVGAPGLRAVVSSHDDRAGRSRPASTGRPHRPRP